ncbi:conserved membrane hypothetical protein [Candidatus Nitrotoga sp. BS]|uniref:hypothetical protein n=1 Tax=Candidatus Nitrotoga sp. BS TaxID=2890408 RepID=UPI001EF3436B|nr:hypothetical protein [Candidatus Nitrotoga sp. BS]CAH1207125.1 conserved membrane hypothetical protein [Candidatus Nitrotoga sp. BS]
MSKFPPSTGVRFFSGVVAVIMGCALNYLGDRILGVKIELFRGILDFNRLWVIDMFVLPFFVGVLVAVIFGLGGKWLCYFPPLIVKSISYLEIIYLTGVPEGASLMPFGMWALFVTVVMTAAGFGGVMGEIIIKKTYGRDPSDLLYKQSTDNSERDI